MGGTELAPMSTTSDLVPSDSAFYLPSMRWESHPFTSGYTQGSDRKIPVSTDGPPCGPMVDSLIGYSRYLFVVLWCFVLNPHRRSPYPNFQLELRDKLRVSPPATYMGLAESCYSPPFSVFRGAVKHPPFSPSSSAFPGAEVLSAPPG